MFLHTGWRSGGTWLWSRCRALPDVHALYEPLHEQLGRLRPADIRRLRPGSWASNHSDTPPYFQEYARLLRPGVRGVPHYRQRFAYERFFFDIDAGDAELEAYLGSLLDAAGAGQVSVLKFCRSLGRAAWLQRRFPGALHITVMRDPVAQWASATRLLDVQRNRYFATAPLLVLARNAAHPLVRAAADALGVRLPRLHSPDIAYGIEICWPHLRRSNDEARYRGFLAFWVVCGIHAMAGGARVIDAKRVALDAAYRQTVEGVLGDKLGQAIDLRSRPAADPERAVWLEAAHRTASELVRAYEVGLPPGCAGVLLGYLGSDAAFCPVVRPNVPMEPASPRTAWQGAITSAAVLAARAIQPVRRLNGALTRPRNQIT